MLKLTAKPLAARVAPASRSFSSSPRWSKQRLVVLGSGWGGYEVMRRIDRKAYDVTIVSPNTYFAFTPLLASTAVGTLEFRCALEPVRRYGDQVASFQAWCESINFQQKTIECLPATAASQRSSGSGTPVDGKKATEKSFPGTKPFTLRYDKLVIACGAYSQTFATPGVKEYAHFLKDVKDARAIRSRILEVFEQCAQPTLTDQERRALLHFVIVGGGPTGVEFAAELHDLLATDMLRHYPALTPLARITLYDVAPSILGAFDKDLVEFAAKNFERQGVTIMNNRHVTAVRENELDIKEEGTVPFGLLVWSTGLAPNPLIESIEELKSDKKTQSLEVNDKLQTIWKDGKVNEDVYALGDASAMLSGKLPATAQVANQQAKHVAKLLNADIKNRTSPGDFAFKNQGILAYVGGWNALFDRSSAEEGPKAKEAGKLAWLLWRSAYFSQAMSIRNKINLAYFWFLNWIFGRDITRF